MHSPTMIVLRNGYGREWQQVALPNVRPYGNTFNLAQAKANGHLMLVSVHTEVLAVDALRSPHDPQETVLWRYDRLDSMAGPIGMPSGTQLRHPWSHSGVRLISVLGGAEKAPLGSLGPVNSSGVCFQRYRQLLCVDPTSGEIIWSREGIEPGTDIWGDESHLFVVPFDETEAMVLSTSTGEMLGTRTVERRAHRWSNWGRNLLAWSEQGPQLTLRIYDPWTRQEIWRREFPLGTRAELVGDDEVAVMQPSGEFVIASLRDGAERVHVQLDPLTGLAHLYVQRNDDRYLVLPAQPVSPSPRFSTAAPIASSPVLQGRLYAIGRNNNELLWQTPGLIQQFSVPLLQPARAPVLVLARTIQYRSGQDRNHASLLCVDKRDGRMLFSSNEVSLPSTVVSYAIESDPDNKSVKVQIAGDVFSLRFTDEPAPPAAPVQTSEAVSMTSNGGNRVRQLAGVIVDAIGQDPGEGPAAGVENE
jgi:hypothetical protein